jgi:hypothetical protein
MSKASSQRKYFCSVCLREFVEIFFAFFERTLFGFFCFERHFFVVVSLQEHLMLTIFCVCTCMCGVMWHGSGAGESGKSTILKQMKVIYLESYPDEERRAFVHIVHSNILESIKTLIQHAMARFVLRQTFICFFGEAFFKFVCCGLKKKENFTPICIFLFFKTNLVCAGRVRDSHRLFGHFVMR